MYNATVVILERNEVTLCSVCVSDTGEIDILFSSKWDPSLYLIDNMGKRLTEEVSRRISTFWKTNTLKDEFVIISLPGTLKNHSELISSSRLGIIEPINIGESLGNSLNVPCFIYHDTECLSIGEIKYCDYIKDEMPSSIVYVFIDEGIGSKIFINGELYNGAGTAGLLGRLIVQPDGAYYPALKSSGALEVYSSRPWVSKRLVEVYHSELNKKDQQLILIDKNYSKFRQALAIASKGEWDQISYERISDGINDNDPIALHVIDYAAKYLGYSINTIITLINPNLIILGGAMISEIPNFANRTINYARQFSWPTAWNNTTIQISKNNRDIQVYGSIELFESFKKTKK